MFDYNYRYQHLAENAKYLICTLILCLQKTTKPSLKQKIFPILTPGFPMQAVMTLACMVALKLCAYLLPDPVSKFLVCASELFPCPQNGRYAKSAHFLTTVKLHKLQIIGLSQPALVNSLY